MLNKKYQSTETAIASYDFTDVAAGTGIINFYAGVAASGSYLSNKSFYSYPIYTTSTALPEEATKIIDKDFDVMLNRPTTIGGKVIINVPIGLYSAATKLKYGYAIAKVRKWNGTTETEIEIAQNTSNTVSISTTGSIVGFILAIDLNIPQTIFKVGEYLRLTIEIWGRGDNPQNPGYAYLAHDPMGRLTGWDATGITILSFQVPVRIDL